MRTTATQRKHDLNVLDETEVRSLYVCARCGTVAHTNSHKKFALDQDISDFLDEHEGWASENSVRMTPPCPCGCDVFNFAFVDQYEIEY